MKNLTKLLSLAICAVLLVGCSDKAKTDATKTTANNTTSTTNSNDEQNSNVATTISQPIASSQTASSKTDLANLTKDSKQIYDIIVAKYPKAEVLTESDNKLIDDYNNKYGWLHGYTTKSDDETKTQTTYINILNLSTDYKKFMDLKSKNAEQRYLDALKREIDRVLHEQQF